MSKKLPLPSIAPCPCGHAQTEITKSNTSGLFSVWCKCCWVGPAEKTKRSAILAWNRRSDAEASDVIAFTRLVLRAGAWMRPRFGTEATQNFIEAMRGEVLPAKGKRA